MFEGLRVPENWPLMGELDHKENDMSHHFSYVSEACLSTMGWAGEGNPKPLALWGCYINECGSVDISNKDVPSTALSQTNKNYFWD